MSKYLSSRLRNLTIGVKDYTEELTVLDVIGNANIRGNLNVEGGSFSIESEAVTLRDPLIELGLIKDPESGEYVPPQQDLGNDVGFVLHYFSNTSSTSQKASVFYDNDLDRIKFASRSTLTGLNNNNVIVNAYAALELGSLWINDCAGQSQVIRCDATKNERLLENISIDCGTYV
jgi:hypothetical protein